MVTLILKACDEGHQQGAVRALTKLTGWRGRAMWTGRGDLVEAQCVNESGSFLAPDSPDTVYRPRDSG